MTRVCVCPGSYDPVTHGHVDVIRRAAQLHDQVVVALLHNPAKRGTFTVEERTELLADALRGIDGVRIEAYGGRLLVDVCREVGAQAIVKGLRSDTDFAYELPMALMNRRLTGVETVFLPGAVELSHLSSSLIKEVVALGGDVSGMVTPAVEAALRERLGRPGG